MRITQDMRQRKHISRIYLGALEEGDVFRFLNKYGKPMGSRFTITSVVKTQRGKRVTAVDTKGFVYIKEPRFPTVKPLHVAVAIITAILSNTVKQSQNASVSNAFELSTT